MPFDSDGDGGPPARPWGAPASETPAQPPRPRNWRRVRSAAFIVLIFLGVGVRAYKDLSRPEAWAYWRDLYFSPSLKSSLVANVDLGGSGRSRATLAISGTIGAAGANWFRDRLEEAHLVAGDVVLLSSPGGNLNQAIVMGEAIRARGLTTAVGAADSHGGIRPSYCASACVIVFAGGKIRIGISGSLLGVHRFTTSSPERDPVAETQRTAGMVLSYMTRMGVSSSVVEAMSATSDIRWLSAQEAIAMNLVTAPAGKP